MDKQLAWFIRVQSILVLLKVSVLPNISWLWVLAPIWLAVLIPTIGALYIFWIIVKK